MENDKQAVTAGRAAGEPGSGKCIGTGPGQVSAYDKSGFVS